jgi:CRP-like cAMP-binding protein
MDSGSTGNKLLDQISEADGEAASSILGTARRVSFASGRKLQKAGDPIEFCHFPTDGVLAMVWPVDGDTLVNTLGIGFDGAVHAGLGTELHKATHHVVSRLPGQAWQVNALAWQKLLDENGVVRKLIASYTDFLFGRTQMALACQMKHDVESRFCRCLLELHHWERGKSLPITHQGLSQLLGVRRTTITLLARSLQDAGIISYQRGSMQVTDLYALRQASCQCHQIGHFRPNARRRRDAQRESHHID